MRIDAPGAVASSNADLLATGLGVISQPFSPLTVTGVTGLSSGVVSGDAVWLRAGVSATGVKLRNTIAAAGTSPTTARFGLADSTGKILVLSDNLNTAASWPAGVCTFAFTGPLTISTSGVYFPCFIVNGSWGTTQPQLLCSVSISGLTADGANPPPSFIWTGQTDLPAVNSSLTITTSGRIFWMAVY